MENENNLNGLQELFALAAIAIALTWYERIVDMKKPAELLEAHKGTEDD